MRPADLLRGVDEPAGKTGLPLLHARHRGDRDRHEDHPGADRAHDGRAEHVRHEASVSGDLAEPGQTERDENEARRPTPA